MNTDANMRKRMRIDFEAQVMLRFEPLDIILEARMKNICINGIFVETETSIAINTPCRIEVIINAPNSRLRIETDGYVCRQDPSGLGIAFKNNLEWFAFFSIFEHYGKGCGPRRVPDPVSTAS
jgi:hypothetical protein